MDVDDFYVLNVAFALGDDDDIQAGITASYDQAAGNALVAGVDLAFDLTDEDDDDQIGMALEAGVMTDLAFAATSFGAAANVDGVFGDEDDISAYLEAWYLQPGFVPTNSDFDPDELGVELGIGFKLTDEEDDFQVEIGPYWGYVMDSAFAVNVDHYVGAEINFSEFDEDHSDSEGMLSAEYSLVDGTIALEAEILNIYLNDDEDDQLLFNIYGEYTTSVPADYDAVANIIYGFEDDMDLIIEGRLDSDGAALYSAEAQLVYAVAENTELKFGVEMNDWEDDINDWDEMNILDTTTKIYGGIEVSF